MAEQLQRVSALDWQFLGIEDQSRTHMHIGSVMTFEGPAPAADDLRAFIASRIGLAPRFRQKLAFHALDTGKPVWVDDPDFDIERHVRAAALPRPGGQGELYAFVGDLFSHRLDRDRPLWQMWFVEGLAEDRWGLVAKIHHTMVDGLGALDLFVALLDLGPEPREVDAVPFEPGPEPTGADLVREQVRRGGRTLRSVADSLTSLLTNPKESAPRVLDVAKGLKDTVEAAVPLPPATPLNVETGPNRGYRSFVMPLADAKAVRRALGGTINDVVLAVTADALGRYLRRHGLDTDGLELRAEMPSAIRGQDTQGADQGNVFVVLVVQLPVGEMAPVDRYRLLAERSQAMKGSGVGTAVGAILGLTDLLAPMILARTSRLLFGKLLFNLLVTNVPGVQFPVYMYGSRLLTLAPLPWVGPQQALSVSVLSYDGVLTFGVMVDRDVVTDHDEFLGDLRAAADQLVAAAAAAAEL